MGLGRCSPRRTASPRWPRLAVAGLLSLAPGLALVAMPAGAQVSLPNGRAEEASAPSERPLVERLAAERAEADAALVRLRSRLEAERETLAAAVVAELERQVEDWQRLAAHVAQHLDALQRAEQTRARIEETAQARAALQDVSRAGQADPVPLPEMDARHDEVSAQRARLRAAERALEAASSSVAQARTSAGEAERARVKAKEAAERVEPSLEAVAVAALDAARARERARRVAIGLREAELASLTLVRELAAARLALAEEQLADVRRRVVFSEAQLAERLAAIDGLERTLIQERDDALGAEPEAERAWQLARAAAEGAADDSAAAHAARAAREALELLRLRARLASERTDRLAQSREAWPRRQALAAGPVAAAKRDEWRRAAAGQIADLDGQAAVAAQELALRRQARDEQRRAIEQLEGSGASSSALRAARRARDTLDRAVTLVEAGVEDVGAARELQESLLRDLEAQGGEEGIAGRAWRRGTTAAVSAWRFDLATVGDQVVTVGGVLKGLLLLVFGVLLARVMMRVAARWLGGRMRLERGQAAALEALGFYAFVLLIALFALHVANVPLTAFAIVGGALAIGVGLGTQSLMNNFISGLILLVEHPIRVGDLVEIRGEAVGEVRRIGARSTRVRTGDGVDVLVPNSRFLENDVVNWTLGDNLVRTSLKVGVAYGSPTREVARILRAAAEAHGRVLEKPEPFVLFEDFGDDALIFRALFWIRMSRPLDARRVQSDLRFMVDNAFREAGITVAFPQRDIHVDGLGPLEVKLIRGGGSRPGEDVADGAASPSGPRES